MQCSPISTSSSDATITPRFRNVPDPILTRAEPGAVIQTPGSSSTPSPISSRPSVNAASTLPCTGQRTNAPRRMNSRWIRRRFHGSELISYHSHFWAQSFSRAASIGNWWVWRLSGGRNRRRHAGGRSQERLDQTTHTVGVIREGPVPAPVQDLDLGARENVALTLGHRHRNVGIVGSPEDQSGAVKRGEGVG